MSKFFQMIASLKLTLVGMSLLGMGSILMYGNPADTSQWVLVLPLILLALNLTAAIITNPSINRQPGLLVFHVALLSIAILAAIGRLVYMDGHIEMPEGSEFNSEQILEIKAGPLHVGALDKVSFVQGPYTVNYTANLRRGLTYSHVKVRQADGQWSEQVVGDDRPLLIEGYRFYTTHNKGFTPILSWIPDQGEPITGRINMPSYPLFEYKQDNRWTPPGGREIKFWLQLNTGMTLTEAWVLDGSKATGVLVVTAGGRRVELTPGSEVRLEGGILRFEALSTWMGYRIFYDPTLRWLFFVSIAGVLGLGHFFWKKISLQPWLEESDDRDVVRFTATSAPTQDPDLQETEPGRDNDPAKLQGFHG